MALRLKRHFAPPTALRFPSEGGDVKTYLHHALFYFRRNFVQLLVEAFVARQAPELRRYVPEADICTFGLHNQLKPFAAFNERCKILRSFEDCINVLLKSLRSLSSPHIPELVDIGATSALNVLIASVVLGVVEFVFLEEISGVR